MLKNVIAMIIAIAVGAIGYRFWIRKDAEESPLNVLVTQMRTRAIIEHERQVTVWYKACPEVKGINPQVMVIWPAKLNYELDLAETKLSLSADGVLRAEPGLFDVWVCASSMAGDAVQFELLKA